MYPLALSTASLYPLYYCSSNLHDSLLIYVYYCMQFHYYTQTIYYYKLFIFWDLVHPTRTIISVESMLWWMVAYIFTSTALRRVQKFWSISFVNVSVSIHDSSAAVAHVNNAESSHLPYSGIVPTYSLCSDMLHGQGVQQM